MRVELAAIEEICDLLAFRTICTLRRYASSLRDRTDADRHSPSVRSQLNLQSPVTGGWGASRVARL